MTTARNQGAGTGAAHREWAERAFAGPAEAWDGPTARHGGGLPFSFTFGGRPFAELAGQWVSSEHREEIAGQRWRLTRTLADPETGLEARVEATVYEDTGGVDWVLQLANRGPRDTPVIADLQAVDIAVTPPPGSGAVLHRLYGSVSDERDWLPMDDALAPGAEIAFGPHGDQANSSSGACPFFTLQWAGGGVVTAIGWSGPWTAAAAREADGTLRLRAGIRCMHLVLHPGESIRSPRILQLYWAGDDALDGANAFRRVMLQHILPQRDGRAVPPPFAHTSVIFHEESACTEADVLAHLASIDGLGFEVFWLDAYWIRDGYPAGTGHYGFPIRRVEPPDRFPHGIAPIGAAAREQGLQFLCWFSPEIVWAHGDLQREGRPWTRFWETDKPLADWGQVDLGDPEAWDFTRAYLEAVIREYGIDWLRIDSGMIPRYAEERDLAEPDRAGMAEIRHVEGLYRLWDALCETFPHLLIDNCFGGGRRIDLETCARALPLWRTDITYELIKQGRQGRVDVLNQMMTAALARYVPFSLCTQMGSEPYRFRSGAHAGVTFSDDCRPAGYPRAQLRAALAEGKRCRDYYYGNFYPLVPVTASDDDWCVLQYHLPEEERGMILAFRRPDSPDREMPLAVREIDTAADYAVTQARDYALPPSVRMPGTELQRLSAVIDDCPGSLLIEYRRADAPE